MTTSNTETKSIAMPDDIEDSKIYKKMVKAFGDEETKAFFKKSEAELRAIMAECQVQASEAKQAVDDNDAFKNAKSVCDVMKKGLREVVNPLNLKSSVAAFIVTYGNEVKRNTK